MKNGKSYQYDVAISYAGEDREYAEKLAEALKNHSITVFYDQYKQAEIWGKKLIDLLSNVYMEQARYCIIFFSKHYAEKKYTNLERQIAQVRALKELEEYILPILLDDTELPVFLSILASVSWQKETVDTIVGMVIEKLPSKGLPAKQEEEPTWYQNFRNGNECSRRREFEDALNAYQQALSPDFNPVVYNNMGVTYYQLGRYDSALDAFKKALDEQRKAVSGGTILWAFQCDINFLAVYNGGVAYNNEGRVLYALGRHEEALVAYNQAITFESNDAKIFYNKGQALSKIRCYKEAVEAYEEAVKIDKNYVVAYHSKGQALSNLRRYEEAVEAYKEAIKLDKNYEIAYHSKGQALYNLKRYNEALEAYKEAIKLYEATRKSLREDIKLFSRLAVVYKDKGWCLLKLKHKKQALEAFEQAIRFDPKYADAYSGKGQALQARGDHEEAREAFTKAEELRKSNSAQ